MEMWTDIAEQLDDHGGDEKEQKKVTGEVEGYDELSTRLRALCEEYGGVHGRVDFFERWQVGEANSSTRPAGSSDSLDGLSSSQLSPSECRRTASLATAADVRNKLDQFKQSLTAHLALVSRWKDGSRRRMVDEIVQAVSDWKGSGGQKMKQRRQQARGGEDGDETDTEDEEEEEEENGNEDDDDDDYEEEYKQEAEERRNKHEDSNDEMISDSQQVDT